MTAERSSEREARIADAIRELQEMIKNRYPTATFEVAPEEDPPGIYVTATVDVDDPDEVTDLIIDRLLELQIDQELPVYVIPIRPLERVLQSLRSAAAARSLATPGALLEPQ